MRWWRGWRDLGTSMSVALALAACGGGGTAQHDAAVGPDAVADAAPDGASPGLPVGAACAQDPQCSGPSPACITADLAPLASFAGSTNPTARLLAGQIVIPLPDGYCSNVAPCASDADCGTEGKCFLPLVDVPLADYQGLVDALGLAADEAATLVGFHDYGQCLKPCAGAADCARPGYVCAVPLETFVSLVADLGGRLESYCIGAAVDPCTPNPCVHGSCAAGAGNQPDCTCDQGWTGSRCDAPDPCAPNPCQHGGTCADDGLGGHTCTCTQGWSGADCAVADPCAPNPCQHGGACAPGGGGFTCACPSGWIGDVCAVADPCLPDPCLHHGTCTLQGVSALCTGCDAGWSGDLCEVPHDCGAPGAVSAPLHVDTSGGTRLDAVAVYSCDASYVLTGDAQRTCTPAGWSGAAPTCSPAPVQCQSGTCNGHGTCVEVGGVFDHCDCSAGWTGTTCGSQVDCGPPAAAPAHGTSSYTTTTYGSTVTWSCDAGYQRSGASSATCQANGSWSASAPTCSPVDCGAPPAAPAHGSVRYTTTTYGSTASYSCDAGYQVTGAAAITCQAGGSWSASAPTCTPSYCDVVYQVVGTFRISDAPASCGNVSKPVSANATTPSLTGGATTPFTAASVFDNAFIRLRFPDGGGLPVAGAVSLIEYYLPMEFTVTCTGTNVVTDVDHSVGLLALTGSPPAIPVSPQLSRPCQSWASGTLTGTSLAWGPCSAVPYASGNGWSPDNAVAAGGDTGCATRMSVWGNVSCSGILCGFVPNLGNQRATWDQLLPAFTFSQSTDYLTATFSMAEVQVPEATSETQTRTWVTITSATPIHHECGAAASLTCDEQVP